MKAIVDERLAARKRRVEQRLDRNKLPADRSRPVLEPQPAGANGSGSLERKLAPRPSAKLLVLRARLPPPPVPEPSGVVLGNDRRRHLVGGPAVVEQRPLQRALRARIEPAPVRHAEALLADEAGSILHSASTTSRPIPAS